jgi:hypothetical protein
MYQRAGVSIVRQDSWTEGVRVKSPGRARRGWVVADGCETRLEYQLRPDRKKIMTYLQLVVGF